MKNQLISDHILGRIGFTLLQVASEASETAIISLITTILSRTDQPMLIIAKSAEKIASILATCPHIAGLKIVTVTSSLFRHESSKQYSPSILKIEKEQLNFHLHSADILICTPEAAASDEVLSSIEKFKLVFHCNANEGSELEILAPLQHAERVVLIGDCLLERNLSKVAAESGYGRSPFQRLFNCGYRSIFPSDLSTDSSIRNTAELINSIADEFPQFRSLRIGHGDKQVLGKVIEFYTSL